MRQRQGSDDHPTQGRVARQALVPRSLPDAVDLRGDGAGVSPRLRRAGLHDRAQPHERRHHVDSDRGRPDPDDVPAAGEGPLRGAGQGLPQQAGARALARAELGHRPAADVRARRRVPARQARVHARPDPHRPRALHRDGHRLERPGQGRHRVLRRPRRVQLDLPGRSSSRSTRTSSRRCCRPGSASRAPS